MALGEGLTERTIADEIGEDELTQGKECRAGQRRFPATADQAEGIFAGQREKNGKQSGCQLVRDKR